MICVRWVWMFSNTFQGLLAQVTGHGRKVFNKYCYLSLSLFIAKKGKKQKCDRQTFPKYKHIVFKINRFYILLFDFETLIVESVCGGC